jgi:purine catabolism regulator
VDYLSAIKDDTLFILAPVDQSADGAYLKKIGENISLALKSQTGERDIAVGIGRVHPGLASVKTAYQEARQALGMGTRLFGPDCLVFFGDLGIYRLLFRLHGTSDLESFYQDTLGALLEYDRKNGAELLKTLNAYFATCGSLTDAAERLHLHRNTLLYRLHRVREIAGIDLDDPDVRLALQLALRIGETLQASSLTR